MMTMTMNNVVCTRFEINVSLNGHHLFATHERSLTSYDSMKKCVKIFLEKFPESEGYKITVSGTADVWKVIDVEGLK